MGRRFPFSGDEDDSTPAHLFLQTHDDLYTIQPSSVYKSSTRNRITTNKENIIKSMTRTKKTQLTIRIVKIFALALFVSGLTVFGFGAIALDSNNIENFVISHGTEPVTCDTQYYNVPYSAPSGLKTRQVTLAGLFGGADEANKDAAKNDSTTGTDEDGAQKGFCEKIKGDSKIKIGIIAFFVICLLGLCAFCQRAETDFEKLLAKKREQMERMQEEAEKKG